MSPKKTVRPARVFGLLVHPMDLDDVAEHYEIADKMSPRLTSEIVRRWPPFIVSKVTGVTSISTGLTIGGVVAVVPLLPEHFDDMKQDALVDKIVRACKLCAKQGTRIVGLGGLNATAGRGGRAVAEHMRIAVTTGNTYTVAAAIEATRRAAAAMDIETGSATLAVLGAGEPVGRACSMLLAADFGRTLLAGRDRQRLSALKPEVERGARCAVEVRTDVIHAVREADVVVVTSPTVAGLVRPTDIRPGAVVCDVVRPRKTAALIWATRDDVLAIDGGMIRVPGDFDLGADLGMERGVVPASMAEPMVLALEDRFEDYTLGQEVSIERVREIGRLAAKHGFGVAGFRRGQRLVSGAQVGSIRVRAAGGAARGPAGSARHD